MHENCTDHLEILLTLSTYDSIYFDLFGFSVAFNTLSRLCLVYISTYQLVNILHSKLSGFNKQLQTFPYMSGRGFEPLTSEEGG